MTSPIRLSIYGMMLLGSAALAYLAYTIGQPASLPSQGSVPAPLQISYLVAAHQLPAGTLARAEDFEARPLPSGDIPAGAITDSPDARASLLGSLVRNFIDTGHPITPADVLRPRDRGFLATVLEPGTRAYSIEVNAISGVSGLIWPGDHVDVILTHEVANANLAHRTSSVTILSDVRVIAVDQDITQGAPTNNTVAGKVAHTVALQVLPKEAEKLAAAVHLGTLSLSIHAAKDQLAGEPGHSTPTSETFGVDVAPALGEEGSATTVLVVEGDKSKEWSFHSPKGGQNGR